MSRIKRGIYAAAIGVLIGVGGALFWRWTQTYAYGLGISFYAHAYGVTFYKRGIIVQSLGASSTAFGLEGGRIPVQVLTQLGAFAQWDYSFAGFGFRHSAPGFWGVAIPPWAVLILLVAAVLAGWMMYRRLRRVRAGKRGFEVMREAHKLE